MREGRNYQQLYFAAVLLGVGLGLAQPVMAQDRQPKPKIVFILMDNLGYGELGVYGGGITCGAPTPRIDQLAAEGTRLPTSTSRRGARPIARPS